MTERTKSQKELLKAKRFVIAYSTLSLLQGFNILLKMITGTNGTFEVMSAICALLSSAGFGVAAVMNFVLYLIAKEENEAEQAKLAEQLSKTP